MAKKLHYEKAATPATIQGWACMRCRKFYSNELYPSDKNVKAMAEICCADIVPCSTEKCPNEVDLSAKKYYSRYDKSCQDCKDKKTQERYEKDRATWEARDKQEWDGESLIYSDANDRYFQDLDELMDYVDECLLDKIIDSADDLWLRICKPIQPPYFEMSEFLQDYLPDDDYGCGYIPPGAEDIEKIVNDYVQKQTLSWVPGPLALDTSNIDFNSEYYPSKQLELKQTAMQCPKSDLPDNYVSPFDGAVK